MQDAQKLICINAEAPPRRFTSHLDEKERSVHAPGISGTSNGAGSAAPECGATAGTSVSVAIAGSGGSGVMTAGAMLLDAAARAGLYGLMVRTSGPQIRGGEAAALLASCLAGLGGPR